MSDAVITALVSTLSTQISDGGATPAAITALSSGIAIQAQTYYNTVQARRVGLLTGISTAGGEDVSKIAAKYTEVMNADAFQRASDAADSDLGQLRNGIPGLTIAQLNTLGTATIARATAYQVEFNQTLPS
jgi:hypothetical protein